MMTVDKRKELQVETVQRQRGAQVGVLLGQVLALMDPFPVALEEDLKRGLGPAAQLDGVALDDPFARLRSTHGAHRPAQRTRTRAALFHCGSPGEAPPPSGSSSSVVELPRSDGLFPPRPPHAHYLIRADSGCERVVSEDDGFSVQCRVPSPADRRPCWTLMSTRAPEVCSHKACSPADMKHG
ncbi:unnamed protein product [Gadus morhua 'NCC']